MFKEKNRAVSVAKNCDWANGSFYEDARQIVLEAEPEDLWPTISSIGGDIGWYYADWLWKIRGAMDQLCGGVGLSRGRRNPTELHPGDPLDFWQVETVEEFKFLTLSAEMKLPGEATLSFHLKKLGKGQTKLQQIARFLPRGRLGILYWYAVMPFHHFVFNGMLCGIAKTTNKKICWGPEKIKKIAPIY